MITFKKAALAVNANRPLRTLAALAVRRSSNSVLIVPEFGMSSEALNDVKLTKTDILITVLKVE